MLNLEGVEESCQELNSQDLLLIRRVSKQVGDNRRGDGGKERFVN